MGITRRWTSPAVIAGAAIACATCTDGLTGVAQSEPLPVVHATIVAGQHLQIVSVEWTATGATLFTRDSLATPDTMARVRWTTPDGRVLEAQPLWVRTGHQRDRGIYVVASGGADSVLLQASRYRGVRSDGLARMDPVAEPGRYALEVMTGRGDDVRGSVVVYAKSGALRLLRVTGTASDTLEIRDVVPAGMPMSVATVASTDNYATVVASAGVVRLPLDAPGRTDRSIAMFPTGETSRLVHYALDSALTRAFWGGSDPLHAGGFLGNLTGAAGVAGYVVPMTVAYVTRTGE